MDHNPPEPQAPTRDEAAAAAALRVAIKRAAEATTRQPDLSRDALLSKLRDVENLG